MAGQFLTQQKNLPVNSNLEMGHVQDDVAHIVTSPNHAVAGRTVGGIVCCSSDSCCGSTYAGLTST